MTKEAPGSALRLREVQIATPDPFPPLTVIDQRSRPRIMDHHEVRIKIEHLGILAIDLEIDLGHLFSKHLLLPLQRVADPLADVKKLLVASKDFPTGIDPQRCQHRHKTT